MNRVLFTSLMIVLCLTACAADYVPGTMQAATNSTPTPFGPGSRSSLEPASNGHSPESIVQAFLIDVQEAPDQIHGYMSSLLKERYPGSSIIDVLNLEGMIEGFAIRSATSNEVMGLAYVTAGISSGSSSFEVEFTLIKENDNWVISTLEVSHPD